MEYINIFYYPHPAVDVRIMGDENVMKCNLCKIKALDIIKHQNSSTCKKVKGRRDNEQKQDVQRQAEKIIFTVNGKPIKRVGKFKYLG